MQGHLERSVWGFSNLGLSGRSLSWDGALLPNVTSPAAPSAAPAPLWTCNNKGHKGFLGFVSSLQKSFPMRLTLFGDPEHQGVPHGMLMLPGSDCAAVATVTQPIRGHLQLSGQIKDREPG